MADRDRAKDRNRPRRRWLSRGFILLGLLLLAGWFAPILVARVPYLRDKLLGMANANLNGQLSVETISLDWLSPIRLYDLEIVDTEGQAVLAVDELHTENTLFQLLRDSKKLGRIHVDRPQLRVVMNGDQCNLQTVLEPLLAAEDDSEPSSLSLEVAITEGELTYVDGGSAGEVLLREINIDATVTTGQVTDISADVSTQFGALENSGGALNALVSCEIGEQFTGTAEVTSSDLNLADLKSLTRRFAEGVDAVGSISGKAICQWRGAEFAVQLSPLSLQELDVRAPRWLGEDQIRAHRCNISGTLTSEQGRLRCEAVQIAMDASHVTVNGAVGLSGLGGSWESTLETLSHDNYEITADIDLATLTAMMPATLRLQESAKITGGKASLKLVSQLGSKQDDHIWIASLETSDLRGEANGRPIVWQQPVQVDARVRMEGSYWFLETAQVRSEFLTLAGMGDAREGGLRFDGDLDQLFGQIRQFVDVRDIRMAGRVKGDAQWTRSENQPVSVGGQLTLTDFQFAVPGIRPLVEPRLELVVNASGKSPDGGQLSLDTGRLQVEAGDDRLLVELQEPVRRVSSQSRWPLKISLQGELSNWTPRVQSFVPLEGLELRGATDLNAVVTIAPDGVELVSSDLRVEKFQLQGKGVYIDEPILVVKAAGRWDGKLRRWTSEATTVQSSALAFAAQNVRFGFAQPAALSGSLSLRGDLGRLWAWTHAPNQPPPRRLEGTFTGTAHFDQQDDQCAFEWTSEHLDVVVLGRPDRAGRGGFVSAPREAWTTIWKEPQLELSGKGRLTLSNGGLDLQEFHCTSDWLDIKAAGSVEPASAQRRVDFRGEAAYDWDRVMRRMTPYLGSGLTVSGRERRTFAIRGPLLSSESQLGGGNVAARRTPRPLAPAELTAAAGLGWRAAHFQGFEIGQAAIEASLEDSVVGFATWNVPVSGGRLSMTPQIDLSTANAVLNVADRATLDHVEISPEMCQTWLKYVAPLLSDATRARGEFSFVANKTTVPLMQFDRMSSQGALLIHQAEVGPGALASQFLVIAQQVLAVVDRKNASQLTGADSWLKLPEQQVDYHVVDGRVHHRGLEMRAKDVIIRTSGSVGFDESLALVAEIPIQDRWVERERLLSGLRGQSLKFQITGTLSKPKIDDRALRQLAKQAVGGAAERMLLDELNKGINRLLQPR